MGQKKPSLRSKAAHLVSDITTVLLNPHIRRAIYSTWDGAAKESPEEEAPETESKVLVGPDTSSFTAFLASLLSSAESSDHFSVQPEEPRARTEEVASSSSGINENAGRKGLFSRGKQMGGYRDKRSHPRSDSDLTNGSSLSSHGPMPVNSPKNSASQISLPAMSEPSLLLSESFRGDLYASLPAVTQGKHWVLLYSTARHGISLSTLYRRSLLCPGFCLLVVGDQMGAVFGGLLEAPLLPSSKRKYQGTNSTFIFTTLSTPPSIFRPTGANRYFSLCSPDFLAIGGGGHFALYLDGDLLSGSSSTSETFGNPCLAHSEDFQVKEVELWGFVYASKYDEMMALCHAEAAAGICRW
ncbi:unnamed protein product [Spirodela intermedia]|uniref:Oxidation resistance protein 1 n=1 Tax=Spirodela intermedia TaxID=51605 RepID=A0A7I8IQP2_SPIIN|nr:unnamed protein product [Spirodela intermedia]CAA6659855.1 unnamed protein product [Spirodela intermedia]